MATGQALTPIPFASDKPSSPDVGLLEFLLELAKRYGPIFELPDPSARQLIVSAFALADEVCDDQRFDKMGATEHAAIRSLAGDGLFTAWTQEPNWHKAHTILLPNFSMQAMKAYLPGMADIASQLVLKWQRLNENDAIDVVTDMTRLTLDTIGICGFGYHFNSFYRNDQHPFVASLTRVLTAIQQTGEGTRLFDKVIEQPNQQLEDDLNSMNALVDALIQERKRKGEPSGSPRDLLGYMLMGTDRQTGERLDDLNIRFQIMTFLIAGHETTSSLLSWALYFLLHHPEVLARAYDEVDRILGGDLAVLPSYEQVHQLGYVSQILKETLRLCPPVPMFSRYPYQDTLLGGRYQVKQSDHIEILVPALHRDPTVWGAHPEVFDPEHFTPEAEQAQSANAYKPFGTGQRACIGRQFALQEAALALGMMLQRFTFDDYTHYQAKLGNAGAIKPLGFRLKVVPRTHQPARITPPAPQGNGHQPVETVTEAQPVLGTTQHATPLLVLYGSNLGTAEDLAHRIADDGTARGFSSTVAPLDDVVGKLPTQGALVVVTSSYNGTPPDNAVKFCAWLQDAATAPTACSGVHYAVFGCGDSNWAATFQAIPKLVDAQLAAHGAQRYYQRGEGDAYSDFDGQFQAWYGSLWPAVTKALGLDMAAAAGAAVGAPLYTLELVTAPEANKYATTFGAEPLPVLVNRELHVLASGGALERSCRHIEVALDERMTYRTGDHLAIIPHNPVELVERALARFGIARDAFYRIHRAVSGTTQLPLDTPVPVIGLLLRFVELQDVATRGQIKRLADYDDRPAEKRELQALAEDPRYTSEILAKRVSLLDLLDEFPACALPFNVFLEWVHPLRPRFYSIASAPLADAKRCAITVSVVEGPARSGNGTYQGVASTYLKAQPANSVVYAYVRGPQMPFSPPQDTRLPIIMVGPGTGFAPFRGFLQEREAQLTHGVKVGPSLLFYGCRDNADFIYKDEMQHWMDEGVTTAYTAYSRLPNQPKQYVQDQIKAHADEVWDLIQRGAVIYVCGDASRMEPDVRRAFMNIYQTKTGADFQVADAWFTQMQQDNRYLADVWAGG